MNSPHVSLPELPSAHLASAAGRKSRPYLNIILGGLLILISLIFWRSSFGGEFIFDDIPHIFGREHELWPQSLSRRTVISWTLALNRHLGGTNPWGYHLLNFLVHLTGGLFLFGITRRIALTVDTWPTLQKHSSLFGFAVASIWLLHPLQTESVTYIIQRHESVAGMFYLGAIYFLVRGAMSGGSRYLWYFLSIVSLSLGMASKEVVATAIVVIPLFDWAYLSKSWKELFRMRGWVYLCYLPATVWLVWNISRSLMTTATEGGGSIGFGMEDISATSYALSQPEAILHYLRLTFWPDVLCLDYRWRPNNGWLATAAAFVTVALMVIASFTLLFLKPRIGFLCTAFFLILAPTSSIVPIADFMVEHRMYLPLACVASLFCLGMLKLIECFDEPLHQIIFIIIGGSVLLISLGIRTSMRNLEYDNVVAMWQNVLRVAPYNGRAQYNLAYEIDRQARVEIDPVEKQRLLERALAETKKAMEVNPSHGLSYMAYARLLVALDRGEEAPPYYERGLKLKPDHDVGWINFGNLLFREGKYNEAAEKYQQMIDLKPEDYRGYQLLSLAHYEQGEYGKAIQVIESARTISPDIEKLPLQQAWILATAGDAKIRNGKKALTLAQETLKRLTGAPHWNPLEVLAAAQAESGLFDQAVNTQRRALAAFTEDDEEQRAEITARLALYEAGKPYHHQIKGKDGVG